MYTFIAAIAAFVAVSRKPFLKAVFCRMDDITQVFDLEVLLAPIEGEAHAGVDLRRDPSPRSLFYRLRDARAEARQMERENEKPKDEQESQRAQGPPPVSLSQLWRSVRVLATEALGKTKDLEVAAWLTEALLRDFGIPGLTAGASLMTGLVENYWDELYPLPDDEGIATRVAPVAGLSGDSSGNGTLILPLRRLALFSRPSGEAVELWRYEQSESVAQIVSAETRQQRIAAGAISFDVLSDEAIAMGGEHFARLQAAAISAKEAWSQLGAVLDVRAGVDSPSTRALTTLFDKIANIAEFFAKKAPPSASAVTAAEPDATGSNAGIAPAPVGAIVAREDALRGLLEIADYFRRAEPLSPLAYTLQEAVRRARMSWPQLLEEIVPDPATRAGILTSLGIRPPNE